MVLVAMQSRFDNGEVIVSANRILWIRTTAE
jgi:hypothetical protein